MTIYGQRKAGLIGYKGTEMFVGQVKKYPYLIKFKDGRISGQFKSKKIAEALRDDVMLGGPGNR